MSASNSCRPRWAWATGGVACCVAVVSLSAWVLWAPPTWLAYIDAKYPAFDPSKPFPGLKGRWFERVCELQATLRKPTWTTADVEELTGIVRRGYPRSIREKGLSEDEWGAYDEWNWAERCLAVRLKAKAPVPPGTQRLVEQLWIDELDAKFPERRSGAALTLIYSPRIEEKYVRARLEALLDDPDERVREVVGLQIGRYDDRKQRRQAYEAKKLDVVGLRP